MNWNSLRRIFMAVWLMSLLLFTVPTGAQSTPDLLAAASLLPSDTDLFISLRSDDTFINQLDYVMNRLVAQVASSVPMDVRSYDLNDRALNLIRAQLDSFAMSWGGGSFEEIFGYWLGDSVTLAFDFSRLDPEPNIALIVEHDDSDAVMAFLQENIGLDRMLRSESRGYVVLDPKNSYIQTFIAVNDERLIYSSAPNLPLPNGPTLADNANFRDTVAELPESQYGIVAYLDLALVMELAALNTTDATSIPMLEQFADAAGALVLGANIVDEHVVLVDMAQQIVMLPAFSSLNSEVDADILDQAFLQYIPTESTMLVRGTDLKRQYETVMDAMRIMASQGLMEGLDSAQVDQMIAQLEIGLSLMTGVNFSNDIIGWMTGNYALFLRYDPASAGKPSLGTMSLFADGQQPINLGIEFGIVIETVDPQASAKLVGGIQRAFEMLGEGNIQTTQRVIAGADATEVSFSWTDVTPTDFIIASNDSIFFIGTEKAAVTALSGSGGISKFSAYETAQRYMLPDTKSLFYFDGADTITLIGDLITGSSGSDASVDLLLAGLMVSLVPPGSQPLSRHDQITLIQQTVRNIAPVIESMTFSRAHTEAVTVSRMVIILDKG